ncbi:MAG TPA: hypothetical protein VFP72_01440 [Kineosporiaceae bacterium]|nr:hypothetical protein [Kineosporiaceae bacterium]
MTSAASVPYADPEPLSEQVEQCRCVEAECAAHGLDLHPGPHDLGHAACADVAIDEAARHLADNLSDYGA